MTHQGWTKCKNCTIIFEGRQEFCSPQCMLSFSVKDCDPCEIDERLQSTYGLACSFGKQIKSSRKSMHSSLQGKTRA